MRDESLAARRGLRRCGRCVGRFATRPDHGTLPCRPLRCRSRERLASRQPSPGFHWPWVPQIHRLAPTLARFGWA